MSLPDTTTTIEHQSDLPTADQLSDIVIVALDSGDMEGVVAALRVMTVVDPRRAAETLAAIEPRPGHATRGGRMTWDLIGEDADAIATDGTLPLDWRTKAKGLRAWANEVGDYVDIKRLRDATVQHAFRCWAPPGEWYGGWWITWHRANLLGGWVELPDEHTWCTGNEDIAEGECAGHADVLCLGFDPLDRDTAHIHATVGMALAYAPPSVHIVCPGEGWPWYSRKIADVTVVGIG